MKKVPTPVQPIALVFPPLVTTNFGTYYPSTAILAGHLAANGFATLQRDLNEVFADFLLRDTTIDAIAAIASRERPQDRLNVIGTARLLKRNRANFYDDAGRHRSINDPKTPTTLISTIAGLLRFDVPISELADYISGDSPRCALYNEFYREELERDPALRDAPFVGISVPMGPQLVSAVLLAKLIKGMRRDTRVVLGGPTMSLMDLAAVGTLLADVPEIDAVVRFDGEKPIAELAAQVRDNRWSPGNVPGVSSRSADESVVHCPPAPGLGVHKLPFGQYDDVLLRRLADPEIGIIQARGCYWGECAYCDFVELYEGSGQYRSNLPQRLVDEMAYQKERHGISKFALITESIPALFAERISRLILERKLDVTWNSFAMVDVLFTSERLMAMRQGGCEHLVIGAESMTDRVLELVRKSARMADNLAFFRAARDAKISLRVNLIPDLPTTTHAEALASLAAFEDVQDCFASVAVFPFEPTRSSDIGRNPAAFGLAVDETQGTSGQAQFANNHLRSRDAGMTDEERQEVHKAFKRFANEFNARKSTSLPDVRLVTDSTYNGYVRVSKANLDVEVVDDRVSCFSWLANERVELPKSVWERAIPDIDQPFRLAELEARIGAIHAAILARTLIRLRGLEYDDVSHALDLLTAVGA